MSRNSFFWLAALFALAIALPSQAQPRGKIFKVGVLTPAERQWEGAAFREGLRELGYIEGANVAVDVRSAEGRLEQMPGMAAMLIKSGVDVVIAVNAPGTRAAIEATKSIPIVMTAIGDPIGLGFVKSLAQPGGNVTGLSNMTGDLAGKRLQMLCEAVPAAKRIAVMTHPDEPIVPIQLRDLQASAPALGVQLEIVPLRQVSELEPAFRRTLDWRAQAILRLAGQAITFGRPTAELALKYRLPSMLLVKEDVEAGALMSYSTDHKELFRRAAVYVDRILKGANPADLPVEQPTKFELIINLKTARQIGLKIPPNVLARADKVIR